MTHRSLSVHSFLLALALAVAFSNSALAQTESVLYNFQGGPGGAANPNSGLISGPSGVFYGTTFGGGTGGTVYKLFRTGNFCSAIVIHSFTGADGSGPQASLLRDAAGNLYGTTIAGGNYGGGVVFELKPVAGGLWNFFVLHNFNFDGINNFDGFRPLSNVVMDTKGSLYGTTEFGGSGPCTYNGPTVAPPREVPSGCGTVFQLTPHSDGTWSEKLVYSFQGGPDGGMPFAGLVRDSKGVFYGTTSQGGIATNGTCASFNDTGCGVIFSLAPHAGGWAENVIYAFEGSTDGANPTAPLVFDHAGNLYGTANGTFVGGSNSAVFMLTPSSGGVWNESTIFTFATDGSGTGTQPLGGVIFDAAGDLYGTTFYGSGTSSASIAPPKLAGGGVVYQLTPSVSGPWTETVLHSFAGDPDGFQPGYGSLLLRAGALYGTTMLGGASNVGSAFSVTP